MKKTVCLFLAVTCLLLLGNIFTQVHAEGTEPSAAKKTILDVLTEKATENALQDRFFAPEKLPEELQGYSIEGKPVLIWFYDVVGYFGSADANQVLTDMHNEERYYQMAFTVIEPSGEVKTISHLPEKSNDDPENKLKVQTPYMPVFLENLLNESAAMSFLEEQHTVSNVVVIGGNNPVDPPCAIYFTDGGVFVRVFYGIGSGASKESAFLEYTWAQYAKLQNAYYTYRVEHAYDENGQPLQGTVPFQSFIEEIYPTLGDAVTQEPSDLQVEDDGTQHIWMHGNGLVLLACGIGIVVLAAGGVIAVVVIRKKHIVQ